MCRILVFGLTVGVSLPGCFKDVAGQNDGSSCEVGSEGCSCTAGGTCDLGLECRLDQCVAMDAGTTGSADTASESFGEATGSTIGDTGGSSGQASTSDETGSTLSTSETSAESTTGTAPTSSPEGSTNETQDDTGTTMSPSSEGTGGATSDTSVTCGPPEIWFSWWNRNCDWGCAPAMTGTIFEFYLNDALLGSAIDLLCDADACTIYTGERSFTADQVAMIWHGDGSDELRFTRNEGGAFFYMNITLRWSDGANPTSHCLVDTTTSNCNYACAYDFAHICTAQNLSWTVDDSALSCL